VSISNIRNALKNISNSNLKKLISKKAFQVDNYEDEEIIKKNYYIIKQ